MADIISGYAAKDGQQVAFALVASDLEAPASAHPQSSPKSPPMLATRRSVLGSAAEQDCHSAQNGAPANEPAATVRRDELLMHKLKSLSCRVL